MKLCSVISLSLLTAITTLSASDQVKAKKTEFCNVQKFEIFKNYLLKHSTNGIYTTMLREGQTVSIDVSNMVHKTPLIDTTTGNVTGRCLVSICAASEGGHPSNYYTDAYWDETTYKFIDHKSSRYK
jgi:hypothetical protein